MPQVKFAVSFSGLRLESSQLQVLGVEVSRSVSEDGKDVLFRNRNSDHVTVAAASVRSNYENSHFLSGIKMSSCIKMSNSCITSTPF